MSQYDEHYSVLVCIWVACVYCKVMYMYVDGSKCDNDCKDDKIISGDGSEDIQEVVMGKDSFQFYLY